MDPSMSSTAAIAEQGGTTTETTPLLQPGNVTAVILAATAEPTGRQDDDEIENPNRPKGFRFAVVYSCILLGDFFVGYDTSCVTTLTPVISDEFHAIGDVGWYGIAYILALASTILAFGQLYKFLPTKPVFLLSFIVFAAGSVICAHATCSLFFIIGRAVAGLGGAGIFSGGSILIANIVPLHNRPVYQGISGGVECISLAFGPAISGAIAHYYSWRISFLIIAPAALLNVLAVWTLVHGLPKPIHAGLPAKQTWRQLDILGMILFVPTATCLILALQWGGSTLAWDDMLITRLLGSAGVLFLVFVGSQWLKGDAAMVPPALLGRRCVALGSLTSFFTSASLYIFGFFLPVYFQAIRGADTFQSGVMYLPSAASLALAVLAAGHVTGWVGYYTPVMILGTVLMSAGAGMMTGFDGETPPEEWVAYQVVFNIGAGAAFQQPYTAVQTVLEDRYVPTAIVVLGFVQELGGIVALAGAQNVFISRLVMRFEGLGIGLDPRDVLGQGTLSLIDSVPERLRRSAYVAYMRTLREVFWVGLLCACLTVFSVGIEWRSVKHEKIDEEEIHGTNGRNREA
ncbi:Putative HC-toxin efflux carrier TOXA [Cytospora mali]|uniref:HC-toxin efflux carrier TOXA n=1 Tax=Cytospora mali TaxID=578113 RepID=A0A194VNP1_CYTMA|nr:Putative HC-toxin efflux carrier TOXA [Valsa mali]